MCGYNRAYIAITDYENTFRLISENGTEFYKVEVPTTGKLL